LEAGCFWTLHKAHGTFEARTYPYSQQGAERVLFRVFDEERVRRNLLMMKYDPEA
jgi:hypothetical protein